MIFGQRKLPPKDPKKLEDFKRKLFGLSWEKGNETASLKELFEAVDALAHSEVLYYYSQRRLRSHWSIALRVCAWLFGTVGILVPLVVATHQVGSTALPWGYVAFAIAASLLAANALFGGSSGHIRFVTTQLSLERLMTLSRLEWSDFESRTKLNPVTPELLSKGFEMVRKYALEIYTSTLHETGAWGETLLAELKKYSDTTEAGKNKS